MVVCEGMSDFDVNIGSAHQVSLVGRVHIVPAVPSSKEAADGVYNGSNSDELRARQSMGVAASVDIRTGLERRMQPSGTCRVEG